MRTLGLSLAALAATIAVAEADDRAPRQTLCTRLGKAPEPSRGVAAAASASLSSPGDVGA